MWLKTRRRRRWVLGSGWITASTSRASETATEAQHSSKTIGLDLLLAWSWFERLSGFVNTNMRIISLFFTMITLCWFLHSQLINYDRKMRKIQDIFKLRKTNKTISSFVCGSFSIKLPCQKKGMILCLYWLLMEVDIGVPQLYWKLCR